jgi:F0F1-type ATP synthase delta subunit
MIKTTTYAQALYEAAHKEGADAKTLVKNLTKHLEAEGRMKLLSGILGDLKRLEAAQAKLAPTVEVAHERESATALKSAREHGIHAEHAHVNPTLIKGWRATGDGKLIDHSAKRELIELYRNITAA